MALYVRAVKIAEDDTAAVYRWGIHWEAEDGTFTIPKIPPEQLLKCSAKELGLKWPSQCVVIKIIRYYKKNGSFPEAMSFQS